MKLKFDFFVFVNKNNSSVKVESRRHLLSSGGKQRRLVIKQLRQTKVGDSDVLRSLD